MALADEPEVEQLPERRRTGETSPILQLKITLRGAKPPIWRRVEVPGETTLEGLHHVIQRAFNWNGGHLHVFETPYGQFAANLSGNDDEFDWRDAASVTAEQVLPSAKSKIRYEYDFGDSWEHDIVVEKVVDRETSVTYPRCTGGRRAAPPDDCGGIWGYATLVEALADESHPDHDHFLDWLGLTTPAQFDPAHFDAERINRRLAPPRFDDQRRLLVIYGQ